MKDTCKQAFFRRKNPGQQRSIEDLLRAGDQEERELEFFNKEIGLVIELFKTTRVSMKFDRMIPSGSSWFMGIKGQRVLDHAHSVMEPEKTISMSKFHQIAGHTGEHLFRPTANYMKLKLTGKLAPCEVCEHAKIRQRNVSKKNMKIPPTRPGYRVFIDIFLSNRSAEREINTG